MLLVRKEDEFSAKDIRRYSNIREANWTVLQKDISDEREIIIVEGTGTTSRRIVKMC